MTSPLKSPTSTKLPTTNCFSKIIDKPANTSSNKPCAPNDIAKPAIPAPANNVGVGTFQADSMRIKARTINPNLAIDIIRTPIVSLLELLFVNSLMITDMT